MSFVVDCAGSTTRWAIEPQKVSTKIQRVLVTGISGNLGRRVAPLLSAYDLVTVDLFPPLQGAPCGKFVQLDLSEPSGQAQLAQLLKDEKIEAVLHLAFVIDPVRTGIVDVPRMWRANVEATQRLLDAIASANSNGTAVRLFVFPSSVSAYGPDLPGQVTEEAELRAHTLPYAIHKREADEICQKMYRALGGCALYVYRPSIFAGKTMDNFILRAIRGKPSGRGWMARVFERAGWKLPMVMPATASGENLFQYVHVDDVARVLLWTLGHFQPGQLRIINLAGRGEGVTFAECARLAGTSVVRLPSEAWVVALLRFFWAIGLSGMPPQAIPYFLGSYTMDTTRLRKEIGADYESVVRFTSREALLDSL
ncbi:MAG: NAD-dependent epimerase/dehydratase family protein [Acidobacteria bacterium]|nr:NAD-dependent epimerase/dehydratase family protein [Acidobacteriota bacterium]MCL5288943.1 NAD-dependent epimerase/dehydratase family protein [Acidobacteriota bacterium]